MYRVTWNDRYETDSNFSDKGLQPGMVYVESAEQAARFVAELQSSGAVEIEVAEVVSV